MITSDPTTTGLQVGGVIPEKETLEEAVLSSTVRRFIKAVRCCALAEKDSMNEAKGTIRDYGHKRFCSRVFCKGSPSAERKVLQAIGEYGDRGLSGNPELFPAPDSSGIVRVVAHALHGAPFKRRNSHTSRILGELVAIATNGVHTMHSDRRVYTDLPDTE